MQVKARSAVSAAPRPPVAPSRPRCRLRSVPLALDHSRRMSSRGSGRIDTEPGMSARDFRVRMLRREHAAEYHTWALEVLRGFPFASRRERRVWELHCAGVGANAIDRMLSHSWRRRARRGQNRRALFVIRRLRHLATAWTAERNEPPADLAALRALCAPGILVQLDDLVRRYGPDREAMRDHLGEYPELAELLEHD